MTFRVVLDDRALDEFLQGEDGPVAASLETKAAQIANAAKRRAPRRTGRLRASITYNVDTDSQGLYAEVGSDQVYARFVELGHAAEDGSRVSPRRYLRPALRALRR